MFVEDWQFTTCHAGFLALQLLHCEHIDYKWLCGKSSKKENSCWLPQTTLGNGTSRLRRNTLSQQLFSLAVSRQALQISLRKRSAGSACCALVYPCWVAPVVSQHETCSVHCNLAAECSFASCAGGRGEGRDGLDAACSFCLLWLWLPRRCPILPVQCQVCAVVWWHHCTSWACRRCAPEGFHGSSYTVSSLLLPFSHRK